MIAVILRRRKLGRGSTRGIESASTTGIRAVRNWIGSDWPEAEVEYVFRWGCTSDVPEGAKVVNSAKAIHWCSNKRQGRLDMQAAGVPVPRTWGTWSELVADDKFDPDMRVVLRPSTHAQGRNLFVFSGQESALAAKCRELGSFYISELIGKVAEYRVMVVQGRVVWVAQKTPGNPEDIAWNVARGGRFDNVRWESWPLKVIRAALAAANVSGCDFCGVDVMVDAEGNPFVLEINSAPSQTSPYRQQCMAKAFDYIVNNGKKKFDTVKDSPRRTWKSYIHPAVRGGE